MPENVRYTIYQSAADAPQPGDNLECQVIGTIRTPYKQMGDCPSRHNGREYLPCIIQLAAAYAPGLAGFEAGGRAQVLYWLHLARRDMVQLPERVGVRDNPLGVFSLRAPPRPNPIAVAEVDIPDIRENTLEVVGLDCLDGTALLDVKRTRSSGRPKT